MTTPAVAMVTTRRTAPQLLVGVFPGIALLALYGLGTRVLPDRIGSLDSLSFGYWLPTPITYWNGLGIFCVVGILLKGRTLVLPR